MRGRSNFKGLLVIPLSIATLFVFCLAVKEANSEETSCEQIYDMERPEEGVVFRHHDWYGVRKITGKEQVNTDCWGSVYHTEVKACTEAEGHELCIRQQQGRVMVWEATELTINSKSYKSTDLAFKTHTGSEQTEEELAVASAWLYELANTKEPVYAVFTDEVVELSPAGTSAALRWAGLID